MGRHDSSRQEMLDTAIHRMYTAIAQDQHHAYPLPVGREACLFVGYPADRITSFPTWAVAAFSGVGYPFAANVIRPGDTVLDVGSGSGTDLLIAAQEAGTQSHVIGLDVTPAMVERVKAQVARAQAGHVRVFEGRAEAIPLLDASVDVVTSNGVLNLVADRAAAFAEIHRVLRPGGRLQLADIAIGQFHCNDGLCDVSFRGSESDLDCSVDEYVAMVEHTGFVDVEVLGQLDYFSASTDATKRAVAELAGACSFVLRAAKPPSQALPLPQRWPPSCSTADGDQ